MKETVKKRKNNLNTVSRIVLIPILPVPLSTCMRSEFNTILLIIPSSPTIALNTTAIYVFYIKIQTYAVMHRHDEIQYSA